MAYKIVNRKFFRMIFFMLSSVLWLKPITASASKIANIQQDSLYYKTFLFYRTKDIDSAMHYARLGLRQAENLRDNELILKSYNALGYTLQKKQYIDSALYIYKKGLAISISTGYPLRSMYFQNSIGNIYNSSSQYDSALTYYYGSLELAKELDREKDKAIALTNIATVNFHLGMFESALSFYEQALEIKERLNSAGLEATYYNIGLLYSDLEEHDQALQYYNKMIELCANGECDDIYIERGLLGMGLAYKGLGEEEKSEGYFLQLLDSKFDVIAMSANRQMAIINKNRGEYIKALNSIKQGNLYAVKSQNKEGMKVNYKWQADIFKDMGELDSSLFYYELYLELKDSLFNSTVAENIQDLFINLERKQAQAEINAKEKQLANQQIVVVLMSLVIILTAIVGWFIIRDLIKRRKQNIYLDKQVNIKTKQLQQSNAELKVKKNDLDNLIYKISHDIRAPLSRLQGLIQVGRIDHGAGFYDKMEEQARDLEKILNRMAVVNSITHHELKITDIPLKNFVNEIIKKYSRQWDSDVDFDVRIGEEVVQSDPELLEISLYNILDNAVRFRVKNGVIVKIGYADKSIYVEDNGQGFDKKYINKITDLFFVANESSGTGIGLHHTSLAIQKLGARLKVASNASPTRFEIVFDT